jgi:hypothetical protein
MIPRLNRTCRPIFPSAFGIVTLSLVSFAEWIGAAHRKKMMGAPEYCVEKFSVPEEYNTGIRGKITERRFARKGLPGLLNGQLPAC